MASSLDMEPSAEDHAYFQAVEEIFVGLRGTPFLLAPADWLVARRWHRDGIPLDLVRESLEEIFARRRERRAKGRISSLRYCAAAVEKAWTERRELIAPGRRAPAPRLQVGPRLAALAAALPADLPRRETFATRILELAGDPAAGSSPSSSSSLRSPSEIEERLGELDRELLAAVEEDLPAAARRALEAEVERALAGIARRLPAAEIAGARERLARQHLRQHLRLPLLSLFSPEAEAAGASEGEISRGEAAGTDPG
jgi:hypothetical protein